MNVLVLDMAFSERLSWVKSPHRPDPSDLPSPVLSILEAVLTVSPNKQYLGIFSPTTPATQEPMGKTETDHDLNVTDF